jgi:hypothetical protein
VKPRPHHGIDDDVAFRNFAEVQFPVLRIRNLDDRQADAAENFEIGPGIAADVGDAAKKKDGGLDAPLREGAAATAWRPAFSISTIDGNPISSIVRRSASRICCVFSTRIEFRAYCLC